MKKTKLNRYKIVYRKGSIEIEAHSVEEDKEFVRFLDEHGKGECKFCKEEILNYHKI